MKTFSIALIASVASLFDLAEAQGNPRPPVVTSSASPGTWIAAAPTSGPSASLPPPSLTGMGRQAQLNSATDFCIYLPPDPTMQNLVDAEVDAVAYCFNPFNETRPFPDGFIKTAHFLRTPNFIQVTGTYDRTKMNLSPNDCGGEYDNHGAENVGNPVGAFIDGGTHWNEFASGCDFPGDGAFCIRSCFTDADFPWCNNQYDVMGCQWVMPGQYQQPGFTDCTADSGDPIGVYGTSTFKQGDPSTPTAHSAVSSSNCQTTASPNAKGVTYYWAQVNATASTIVVPTNGTATRTPSPTASATGSSAGSTSGGSRVTIASGLLLLVAACML